MFISKNINKLLPFKNFENIYVVADFDRTITIGSSQTSWGILANSNLMPKSYSEERNALYNHYPPIEIDKSMDFELRSNLVKEWFIKYIELLIKK